MKRNLKIVLLGIASLIVAVWAFCWLDVYVAHATLSYSGGIHAPGIRKPTTVTIGPVSYNPGNGHVNHRPVSELDGGGHTALDAFLHPEQEKRRLQKLACAKNRFGYVMRHGVTTPTPLKGFHGCAKYALDAAYWRNRRNEPSLKVQTDPLTVIRQSMVLHIHDSFIQ